MKKAISRWLSVILAVCMTVVCVPISAYSAPKRVDNAVWKYQSWNDTQEKEIPSDWMESTEDGVIADYQKFFAGGVASPILYRSDLDAYENSLAEFDITVLSEYDGFFRVGFLGRFQDGKNLSGIALEKGYQYTNLKNGSEQWPALENQGTLMKPGTAYHVEIVTADDTMTLYVDGVKSAVRTNLKADAPEKGIMAFRIWGGDKAADAGKKVKIENFTYKEIRHSSILEEKAEIAEEEWGSAEYEIPVAFAEVSSLASIKNNGQSLVEGEDYEITEDAIIIKKDYIASQTDSFTLDIEFDDGSSGKFQMICKRAFVQEEYVEDFSDGNLENWEQISGNGTVSMEDTGMLINGATCLVDNGSLNMQDGEMEVVFEELNDDGGVGLVFRADDGEWESVYNTDSAVYQYYTSKWNVKNSAGANRQVHEEGTPLVKRNGVDHKLKIRFMGQVLTMWMDDQIMFSQEVSEVGQREGKIGLSTAGNSKILVKKVMARNLQPLQVSKEEVETTQIEKDGLSVTMNAQFPQVIRYQLNGNMMNGAELPYYYVTINTVDYLSLIHI